LCTYLSNRQADARAKQENRIRGREMRLLTYRSYARTAREDRAVPIKAAAASRQGGGNSAGDCRRVASATSVRIGGAGFPEVEGNFCLFRSISLVFPAHALPVLRCRQGKAEGD
jgi:hypothetical protein